MIQLFPTDHMVDVEWVAPLGVTGPGCLPGRVLVEFAERRWPHRGDSGLAAGMGVSATQVIRWRAGGSVTVDAVDRAALCLGLHPSNLFSEWGDVQDAGDQLRLW